jgi:hypothetical protein
LRSQSRRSVLGIDRALQLAVLVSARSGLTPAQRTLR